MVVGHLWNNKTFEIISVDEKLYVLNLDKWNGEVYSKCWEVTDKYGFDRTGNSLYTIKPIYQAFNEDEFEIVGYDITKE